eukprot:scaffold76461_cov63-Phaeocystis_antarctica.AAC.1
MRSQKPRWKSGLRLRRKASDPPLPIVALLSWGTQITIMHHEVVNAPSTLFFSGNVFSLDITIRAYPLYVSPFLESAAPAPPPPLVRFDPPPLGETGLPRSNGCYKPYCIREFENTEFGLKISRRVNVCAPSPPARHLRTPRKNRRPAPRPPIACTHVSTCSLHGRPERRPLPSKRASYITAGSGDPRSTRSSLRPARARAAPPPRRARAPRAHPAARCRGWSRRRRRASHGSRAAARARRRAAAEAAGAARGRRRAWPGGGT